MKRCPQCNRIESDNTLTFCRVDGTALTKDSHTEDSGTIRFDSATVSGEAQTNVLSPALTNPGVRPVQQTSVLPTPFENKNTHPPANRKPWPIIVALILVTTLGAIVGGYFYTRTNKTASIESIAVLPFQNKSGNADSEYLSDGLTESLIYRLSQLPNLKVSPTSSVMRYKGRDSDIAQVAKQLEVDAVMSGRLAQRGDDLTISIELIDSRTKKLRPAPRSRGNYQQIQENSRDAVCDFLLDCKYLCHTRPQGQSVRRTGKLFYRTRVLFASLKGRLVLGSAPRRSAIQGNVETP